MEDNSVTKLSIFNSIVKMLITAMSFFLGVYYNSIGLTGAQIGIIFALGTITSIITILPSGLSNDRLKSKHLIGIALTLIAIFYFGLSQTHNFYIIALMALLGGMGGTIYTTSSESLFYKSTNKDQVSKKIGIFQGLNYLMVGLGMICAGFLLEKNLPFEKLFFFFAIAFLAMTLISQITLPKNKTSQFALLQYKKDIFRPKILLFLLIMFLFAIHFGAESTTYGLFLRKTLNLTTLQMGLYMGFAIMTMALAVQIISKKLHKWKTQYILAMGLFMSGAGHILMTINDPIISAFFRIFHEIGDAAMFFFVYYGITNLFDLKRIGGNASIFTFTATIGSATGAIIFGPMGESLGYHVPLIVSGSTTLLALALSIQFLHYFDHHHEYSNHEYSSNRP
ncbi:MAG: MFS transporter [Nitrospirota bacterium]